MTDRPEPACADWYADYDRHHGIRGDETGEAEARFLIDAMSLQPSDAVLDAPCGAGRIAYHLATLGCRVTGVDLTPAYLARARRRFAAAGLPGRFIQGDLRRVVFDGTFDAVVNWQGSFGYFGEADNRDLLRRFVHALRPGGRLVIDQPNREWLLRHFRATSATSDIESRSRWEPVSERVETQFRQTKTGEAWSMTIRLYTPGQFRSLFEAAGLTVMAMYGQPDGRPYRRGSRRVIVVGRRADR